jgi:hypothetical protein
VESNDEGLRAYDPQTGTWADLTMVNGDFVSVLHALLQYVSIATVQNPLQQWVNDPPLTSVDRCYYGVHGTCAIAVSAHINDGHSDITDRCYCWTHGTRTVAASAHGSDGHPDISGPLLLLDMWHTRDCC